ncbi:TPA: hypothetical protein DEP90_01725 [Patescibacteria group bacterium]|nr:hypothetical protein [Patescibacteria group bacterium]
MKLQQLQFKDFANTKRWKMLDQKGSGQQLLFRLGHLNPEVHIDSIKGQANKVLKREERGNVIETTSTVGISTKKGKLTDFYNTLTSFVKAGYLPGESVASIEKLRTNINKDMPEECDLWVNISIAKYASPKAAAQALENLSTQFTKGFMNIPIPGAENMTPADVFKSPEVKKMMKKQGATDAQINETLKELTSVSKQVVKETFEMKVKYKEGDFHGYSAVYAFAPFKSNPEKKPIKADGLKDSVFGNTGGGGGIDTRVKLPANAFDKEDLPINGCILQAVQTKNYMITGDFLTYLNLMPSGKSFCQSLTKFKTKTETTHVGGTTFIDHYIIPINSNLKKEGYPYREEFEDMMLKLISSL